MRKRKSMIASMILSDGVVLGLLEEVHSGAVNHLRNVLNGAGATQ